MVICLQVSALSSVLLGVCMAEVGVSIQHDANHGAYSGNTMLEYMLGTTLDVVGASSFMWKQQHVVGHHTYTNVDGLDPDIRVKDPDVRRVSHHQPWQSYQVRLSPECLSVHTPGSDCSDVAFLTSSKAHVPCTSRCMNKQGACVLKAS